MHECTLTTSRWPHYCYKFSFFNFETYIVKSSYFNVTCVINFTDVAYLYHYLPSLPVPNPPAENTDLVVVEVAPVVVVPVITSVPSLTPEIISVSVALLIPVSTF